MEIMNLRECFIKNSITIILILFIQVFVYSQVADNNNRSKWIPDYAITQYAGSIGAVSFGAGYSVGKNNRTHFELLYGYTPKYDSDERMSSITIKGFKTVFGETIVSPKNKLSWIPLKTGVGLSYMADNRFFSFRTELPYEFGYYGHRTGVRSLVYFQSELVRSFEAKAIRSIRYYLEANVQGLYIMLKYADKNFTVFDMIKLGMGVRVQF
jgi:hypothetical protein